MNLSEQEQLFKRIRRRFRQWSVRQCSGYIHGIVDQYQDLPPSPDMTESIQYTEVGNTYAIGYLYGYADALGPDAEVQSWCIGKVECRWWKK